MLHLGDSPYEGDSAGLLRSLAAAYPVEYFTLIDSAMQSGPAAQTCVTGTTLLDAGVEAFAQHPAAVLQQPQAVLALASAIASTVKLFGCVYLRGEAVVHGQDGMVEQNRQVLAVVPHLVLGALSPLAAALRLEALDTAASSSSSRIDRAAGSGSVHCSSSSSSSSTGSADAGKQAELQLQQQQQERTSTVLLLVVLARSLVVLADGLEAAAVQVGLSPAYCLTTAVLSREGRFHLIGAHGDLMHKPVGCDALTFAGGADEDTQLNSSSAALCWQRWQACMVNTAGTVAIDLGVALSESAVGCCAPTCPAAGATPATTAAATVPNDTSATPVAAAAAAACAAATSDTSSLQDSGRSAGRLKWPYLLQLVRSKKLAAACGDFSQDWLADAASSGSSIALRAINLEDPSAATPSAVQGRQQAMDEMYSAALQFCRVLAGAAPLPHLCNNLGCSRLAAGGTEAAAAVKVCSGCGAWYCSAGCAAAHWRQHKKACRRMAALRLNVNV
jgi:hypothetical protein